MTKRRRRIAAVIGPVTVALLMACSSSELITPQQCRGETCTCEQDPQQLRCRGFSPDGNVSGFEDSTTPDVGVIEAGDADADDGAIADAADGG